MKYEKMMRTEQKIHLCTNQMVLWFKIWSVFAIVAWFNSGKNSNKKLTNCGSRSGKIKGEKKKEKENLAALKYL